MTKEEGAVQDAARTNWEQTTLGAVCSKVVSGGTPRTTVKEYYDGGNIPWLSTKEVNYSRILATEKCITEAGLNASSAQLIPENSVIVALYGKGTAGRVAINGIPLTTNQACCNLIIDRERADYRFVYYYLTTQYRIFTDLANGSVQQNLSARGIKDFPIKLPPLPEQRAIAHILGTLDDKIELNRRMAQTLEAIAQALFKSWFIDFDPVIDNALAAGSPIPEPLQARAAVRAPLARGGGPLPPDLRALFPSAFTHTDELGWIPEGWTVSSLDRIAEYLNGLACQKYLPQPGERDLPVIKIRELRSGSCDQADRATDKVPSKYLVQDGDILFSWSGTLLVKPWVSGKGVLNQHLFKVTSQDYPKWFYYFWTCHHLQDFIGIAADKATTMGHIKRHHLTDAKVCAPNTELLQTANAHLEPMLQALIDRLLENRQLSETRDALLPRLLSGILTPRAGHASVVAGSEDA